MARNTKEKAQETRNRILDAAEDVFYSKGVSNTSLNDVAQAANVTRGAIYWHFKNKADLFDAMCDRIRAPIRAMVEEIADEKTTDPIGRLRLASTHFRQQVVENPHYHKVLAILFHRCEFLDANDPILKYQRDWMLHSREST
ncbi:MAG: TetR family transcriptional regulator, partial [Burkholderiaceae bacterium]|nr:TetR family transcriptional regulator [Burkholderiaceae bacterium]